MAPEISLEQILSAPSAATPFSIKESAIEDAKKILGVTLPVKIKVTSGENRVGSHRCNKVYHAITVSKKQSREEINKTLWHELQHAADCELVFSLRKSGRNPKYRSIVTERKAIETEKRYADRWLI